MNKTAIYERAAAWGHKPGGRVFKALDKVFSTVYPKDTNLVLEFLKELIGTPYGHVDKCMDKVVDCAELPRITFYIWFGIDIGSFSDTEYKSKLGTFVTMDFKALNTCLPLDLAFYKTSTLKVTGHVAIVYDSTRIFQSGASSNNSLVNFSPITWLPKGKTSTCFKGVKRFLTDEQYNSVIVGAESEDTDVLQKGSKGTLVGKWQDNLLICGYKLPKYGSDEDFGSETEAATNSFKLDVGLETNGIVDGEAWAEMADMRADIEAQANDAEVDLLQSKINAAKSILE